MMCLANELAEFKPGDTVKLTIYRSSSSAVPDAALKSM